MAVVVGSHGRDAGLLCIFQLLRSFFEARIFLKFQYREERVVGGKVSAFAFQMALVITFLIAELAAVHSSPRLDPWLNEEDCFHIREGWLRGIY